MMRGALGLVGLAIQLVEHLTEQASYLVIEPLQPILRDVLCRHLQPDLNEVFIDPLEVGMKGVKGFQLCIDGLESVIDPSHKLRQPDLSKRPQDPNDGDRDRNQFAKRDSYG